MACADSHYWKLLADAHWKAWEMAGLTADGAHLVRAAEAYQQALNCFENLVSRVEFSCSFKERKRRKKKEEKKSCLKAIDGWIDACVLLAFDPMIDDLIALTKKPNFHIFAMHGSNSSINEPINEPTNE